MAHAIPELVYEMYQNSTIEEMIAATESVWDRYCNPIAFAMEADEGTDGETRNPALVSALWLALKPLPPSSMAYSIRSDGLVRI